MTSRAPSPSLLGRCTLVGAGPGDPELLTLKAVKALQQASLVLVDDLVNPDILSHVGPHARIVHVGKRGGCVSTPQAFIHKLMIQAVHDGERVVRLKGGDPFVFGRGGEEVEELRAAGIAVQVINGITSGLAAVTQLGCPLTHRQHAQGVVLVTGHQKPGGESTDWVALGRSAQSCNLTLVIYMGAGAAQDIQSGLLQSMDASTPVALVQHATLSHQKTLVTTLAHMVQDMRSNGLGSPCIIAVGQVLESALAAAHDLAQANETEPPVKVASAS